MAYFDSKAFNEKAFKYTVDNVPSLNMNEIKKSSVLVGNEDIKGMFANQNGAVYGEIAMKAPLSGTANNYDGVTDITADSTTTYSQGVIVTGRSKAWVEKDFSADITGVPFMDNVATQVAEYVDNLDQNTILAIMKGIFAMTGTQNLKFVNAHTYDISAKAEGNMGTTTLNTAISEACGVNKRKFKMVFVHSAVATNLENKNLVTQLKYTDDKGVQRDLTLYTWNGRLVLVDDELPTASFEAHYVTCLQTDKNALKVIADTVTVAGENGAEVEEAAVAGAGEITATDTGITDITAGSYVCFVEAGTYYTTYSFGEGSIYYEELPIVKPYEMDRDALKNGGEDTLIMRQRKCFAPKGISFTKKSMVTNSPTDAELENGTNWSLVNNSSSDYLDHRHVAICRIISRG